MLIVPVQPLPNQTLQVQLSDQACVLSVYQLMYGLFADVSVGTDPKVSGVICLNLNRLVRYAYLGFTGDFVFLDTQGTEDPIYTGLGSRFQLVYLELADLVERGLV